MISACISHELRNPLNSIIAQNIEKREIYEELEKIIDGYWGNLTKGKLKKIVKSLKEGMKVQDSSANLMKFIVQDFLDYAQIKAGKFRVNTDQFDIREAVEKVMCIQR